MVADEQRDISAEISQFEDGSAILAAMLADMLAGIDRVGSGDSSDDSLNELEGSKSSPNHRVPASAKHVNPEVQRRNPLRRHPPGPHGAAVNAILSAFPIADVNVFAIALADAVQARAKAAACSFPVFTRKHTSIADQEMHRCPVKQMKNSKNRARDGDFRQPRQETTKGKEIVDEKLVKAGAFRGTTVDDFSEAGYGCDHCDWTTAKRGSAGIQALRAHSKVHVRDRRAVANTLLVQVAVLVVAVMVALSPSFMRIVPTTVIGEMRTLDVPINAELIVASDSDVQISSRVGMQTRSGCYPETTLDL